MRAAAPAPRVPAPAPAPAAAGPTPTRGYGGVVVHAVLVLVVFLLSRLGEPSLTLTIGGVAVFCTYIWLGLREARRSTLWFTPLSFYLLFSSIGLGLSAIYLGGVVARSEWVPFATRFVLRQDVVAAYVAYLLASLCLHAGVQTFRPLRPREGDERAADLGAGRVTALGALWLLGVLTSVSSGVAGLFGGAGGFLKLGAFAAVSALAITPRRQLRLSSGAWTGLLVVGTAGLFVAHLMSYSKAFLMYSFLPVIWVFLLRPRLRRWIPALAVGLVLFYFGAVAPVVAMARNTPLQPGQNPAVHLLSTASLAFSGVSYAGQEVDTRQRHTAGYQVQRFLNRMFDPLPLGFVMAETRSHGFLGGSSFERLAYALVPRVLWPDKPVVSQGAWFAVYLGFAESEQTTTSVWGITAAGELYWNFGIPGLVLGMLLIGAIMGGLWSMAGADPRRKPVRMLLYTIVMLNIVNMETAVTVLVWAALLFLLFRFAFLGLRLIPRARRRNVVLAAR